MTAPSTDNGYTKDSVNGSSTTNGKSSSRLSIIIVGAGLGGLACGIALREFADVTVCINFTCFCPPPPDSPVLMQQILEAVKDMKEIGAAVHLAPNAHRLIQGWGGDLYAIDGVVCSGYREWSSSGQIVIDSEFQVKEQHGCDWVSLLFSFQLRARPLTILITVKMLMHRVDLHNELRRLATRADGPGVPCKLETGRRVVKAVRIGMA